MLRRHRAIAVLEVIGNLGDPRPLQALAKGALGARLTQEAVTALKRLAR